MFICTSYIVDIYSQLSFKKYVFFNSLLYSLQKYKSEFKKKMLLELIFLIQTVYFSMLRYNGIVLVNVHYFVKYCACIPVYQLAII